MYVDIHRLALIDSIQIDPSRKYSAFPNCLTNSSSSGYGGYSQRGRTAPQSLTLAGQARSLNA